MKRPVFLYAPKLPHHSPADLARKAGWMKQMWFVIPVVSVLATGDLWRDPLAAVLGVAITCALGVAAYYLIRISFFRRRPKPLRARLLRVNRTRGILPSRGADGKGQGRLPL